MKARAVERFDFGARLGEISHILALGPGRAVVVSRYRRQVVILDGNVALEVDLLPLAKTALSGLTDLTARGAPFRWADGFGVTYTDVLHLWPTVDHAPVTLAVTIADAEARRERGRLEPILACGLGQRSALVALHAGAASVHAAHRLVRVDWNDTAAEWTRGDHYLDLRSIAGLEESPEPSTAPHPPAIQAIRGEADGVLAHTTGYSKNHARYGMEVSGLVRLDPAFRVSGLDRIDDGYAEFGQDQIALQRLQSRSGGLDFVILDRARKPQGEVRITKKALLPIETAWLRFAVGPRDLWFADDAGRVARFEIVSA